MRDDSYVVLNFKSILGVLFLGGLTVLGTVVALDDGKILSWIWTGIMLALALSVILFSPIYCTLSPEGIKIVYLFGLWEYAPWEEITEIECRTERKTRGRYPGRYRGSSRDFYFKTLRKSRKAFFLNGSFPASKRMYDLLWYFAKDKMTETYYKNGRKQP